MEKQILKKLEKCYKVADTTLYKLLRKYKSGLPLYSDETMFKTMGRPSLLSTERLGQLKNQHKKFPTYSRNKQNNIIRSAIIEADPCHVKVCRSTIMKIKNNILDYYN